MKTLLFCNLVPLKTGAYETLLAAVGQEFKRHGDEYVVVFAGEPIPPVADSLRAAGVRWRILPGWVTPGSQLLSCSVVKLLRKGPKVPESSSSTTQQPNNSTTVPATAGTTGEAVRPWAFVLPALRIIRQERPDVVAVHFGNELPTLAASLLCRLMAWCDDVASLGQLLSCSVAKLLREGSKGSSSLTTQQPNNPATHFPARRRAPRWVWEQDQQIQDPGRISRWFSKIRLLGLGVDQYLAVYEGGRQSMLKRGIPAAKITVIHNSVAPYTPTRPKGWLRRELGAGGKKEKSFEQKLAKNAKGEVGDACGEKPHALGFEMQPLAGEAYTPQPPLRASRASVQTPDFGIQEEPDVAYDEVILVTNGSLIPRKRIDFILRACSQLQKEKSSEQKVAKIAKEEGDLPRRHGDTEREKTMWREFDTWSTKSKIPATLSGEIPGARRQSSGQAGGDAQQTNPLGFPFKKRGGDFGHGSPWTKYPHHWVSHLLSSLSLRASVVKTSPSRSSRPSVQIPDSAPWRLLVIGEGPERERLEALAAELGIADRVHFLGLRNDVREILPECDIYLHASKAETCTYAVTESMAAGIPAVMLNAGAAKEQIEQGVTGYVHDVIDPISFSACIGDLMDDSVRRVEMGRLAKCRWAALFLVERAATRYRELYARMAHADSLHMEIIKDR